MNLILTISRNHYKAIQLREEDIWKNYESLIAFINSNLGHEFQNTLARPFLSGNNINWHSQLPGDYKHLEVFSKEQKEKLLLRYHTLLLKVHQKANELAQSANPDNLIWSDLLKNTFNEKSNLLFSNGTDLILVWGFQFNNSDENYIDPGLLASYLLSLNEPEQNMNPHPPSVDQEVAVATTETNKAKDSISPPLSLAEKKKIIVRSSKTNRNGIYWLSPYWWVLLIVSLIIYLLFLDYSLAKKSTAFNQEQEALENILPSDPLRRPKIDDKKIIKGDSGTAFIIADLINIALKNKTQKLATFVIDLKKAFPDSSYKVTFYDTTTSRIQFQFPDSNRGQLKENIRKQLQAYELLIWDESLFTKSKTFNDPIFKSPDKSWHLQAIGANAAWDITTGDTGITVAVIDDGFDLQNPDLQTHIKKPFNVKTRNSIITSSTDRSHGTHVAGLAIGRSDNGIGISGVAPNCAFMPIQVSDETNLISISDVIDGILYAIRNGADVINLSMGKEFSKEIETMDINKQRELATQIGKDEAKFWNELFEYAEKENVTIVLASGNQHIIVGLDPMQRSDKTIKVSAINSKREPSKFSNYGALTTVYAPGEKVYGLIPGNQEAFMDGTSMASPIVAGAIALLKSKKKSLTTKEIVNLLIQHSDPLIIGSINSRILRADKLLVNFK